MFLALNLYGALLHRWKLSEQMKPFYIILLMSNSVIVNLQELGNMNLIGTWDGGEAFAGEYDDKRFEITFFDDSLVLHYGPNYYQQYSNYEIYGDTIQIIRKDKKDQYNPVFKIKLIDSINLKIEALNWPAVYISNTLSTPYQNVNEEEFWNNQKEDLTQGGVLNVELSFTRKTK